MEVEVLQLNTESEFRLVNVLFPDVLKLSEDPCNSSHDTPCCRNGANVDDRLQIYAITVDNVMQEITTMNGTIKEQTGNRNRISVGKAVLKDVAYSHHMRYNLCSLSRLMDDGWKMKGDVKGIMIIKKGNKLVFNIVV